MKKIFSLLCATLLVFSASAAQMAPKAELAKKAPVAVKQMQKVPFEKAQFAKTASLENVQLSNQLSATPALKVTNQKAPAQAQVVRSSQMLKKAQAPAHRTAPSAKKAAKAPLNTAITIGTFSPATYEGEYYVILTDANSTTQFIFDINTSVNPFELGKTYTLNDMIKDYVALGDKNDWYVWETATAATYTETKDAKGLTHIVASMTTESGTYDLTYDQPEPKDIDVTAVDWSYDASEYDIYVSSETTDYLFELAESTGGLEYGKAYTYADMYPAWTCTLDAYGYPDITATDATLTVSKDEAGLVHIVATMVLSGDTHKITYDEKPFVPSGTKINVDGTDLNGRYMSYYGFYLYTAKWGDYTVQLAFNATEEKTTYTNDDFNADYSLIYSNEDEISLAKLASDITITTTDTTKTLAGSVYAENGDEYVLNLVYEKPDAKEITLNADTLNFVTMGLKAGYYTMDGYNEDSTYEFSFYFLSKSLTGFFTEEDMDAYSTWVDQKEGTQTVVSYQNLSEANIDVYLKNDTLYYTGTMTLATNDGQEAEVTLNLSCPYKQEWGEWEDYAPLGFNTGKYILDLFGKNLRNIPVQVRKANTGLKQYKLAGWGAGYFCEKGADLIIEVDGKNVCTIAPTYTGFAEDPYFAITDYDTWYGTYGASTFDPETCTFNFMAVWYNASNGERLSMSYDSFVMDRPITERDTVKVNLNGLIIEKDIDEETGDLLGWLYIGEDTDTTYLVQVVGAEKYGTFSYADSTLGEDYPNIIPSSEEGYAIPFYEGEVTTVEDEEGIKLTGLMIGDDEKAYVLNWILPAGVIMYDTDAPFVCDFAWKDMSTSLKEGVATISIYNGEKAVGLELYCDPAATKIPAGVYTISDTQEAATALQSIGLDEEGYLQPCSAESYDADGYLDKIWFLVEGTVSLSYDDYGKLNVEVNAKNSYGQDVIVNVTYEKIEPKNTVTIADAELYIYEGFMDFFGLVNFYGGNEEFGFDLYAYSDTLFGDFTNNIDFMDCGLYIDTVELGVIDANLLEVTLDGKDITFKAEVLGSDTVLYVITATGYYGALDYDTNDDYEGVYEFEDVVFDQEAVDDANYIIIQGENEAGDYFALAIEGKLTDEGAIAAGEYTEVWASFGLDEEYYPSISFVWDAEDYLWFIQSGKLTVYENGAMFFEGLNSYDKNVTITVNEEPSALINTKATMKAVKALKNGMIVIKKNGKAYNVLGIAL